MALEYRRITQEEARTFAVRAANLIYSTGDKVFDLYFGRYAKEIVAKTFVIEDSWCGFNLALCAIEDGELIGIEIGYDGETKTRIDSASTAQSVMFETLPPEALQHLGSIQPYAQFLMHNHTPEGAYYVLNLASHEDARGKGIGKFLLQNAFERAKAAGLTSVQLDVFNNKPAVPFYLSQGMEACAENYVPKFRDNYGVPPFIRMVKWL